MKLQAYIAALHAALFAILLAVSPAGSGSITLLGAGKAGTAVAAVTFDSSKTAPNITLSGGALIATNTVGSAVLATSRSTTSHSSGKFLVSFTLSHPSGASTQGVGIMNASQPFANGDWIGESNNSSSFYSDGNRWINGGSSALGVTFTDGSVVHLAVDVGGGLMWASSNGGTSWNGGAGTPAAGTGGASIAAVTGALFVGVDADSDVNVAWTFNPSPSPVTGSTGFGNW